MILAVGPAELRGSEANRSVGSAAERSSADPYIDTTIDGEFTIDAKLGSGGMGTVYRAMQRVTERAVAVKVLHAHVCDEATIARFRKEAQIISRLSHPNIVTVYKYGQHSDGLLYIAMEYLRGQPLDAILQSGQGMDIERALPLMIQMADALAYAHDQKVIHRDIKPENIILVRSGRTETVKILDFGIAKMVDGNSTLTKSGLLCGSPPYMAPEQWAEARDIDGRTDIYGLGCVFYELITGKQPYQQSSVIGYMRAHLNGPTPPPPIEAGARISGLPGVGEIIMKCLSRERADRYADAYDLVAALKEEQLALDASRLSRSGPSSVRRYTRATATTQIAGPGPAPADPVDAASGGDRAEPAPAADVSIPPASPPLAGAGSDRSSGAAAPRASIGPGQRVSVIDPAAQIAARARDPSAPPATPLSPISPASPAGARSLVSPLSLVSIGNAAPSPDDPPESEPPLSATEPYPIPVPIARQIAISDAAAPDEAEGEDPEGDEEAASNRLREVAHAFPRRDDDPADDAAGGSDQNAGRTHVLVVVTGSVLCIALAVALVLLR